MCSSDLRAAYSSLFPYPRANLDATDTAAVSLWNSLVDGDSTLPGAQLRVAVTHYFFTHDGNSSILSIPNLRFSDIEENWSKPNNYLGPRVTAFTYSCAYIASGVMMQGHDGRFMPTTFIDGSGRTINMGMMYSKYPTVINATSSRNVGDTQFDVGSNIQIWARLKNMDTRPGGGS